MVKHPEIKVKLVGENSNAFNILSICGEAMRKAKLPPSELNAFYKEATKGDYNHLLATCADWFIVE